MKTKVLFICMAVCAMVMGLVSCEPVNNDNSPLVGQWIVEGDDSRTIEFDEEKAMVISYEPSGEIFSMAYYEYIIDRKKVYFAVYTPDLELRVLECDYRFDGDNSVIISKLNVLLYFDSSVEPSRGYDAEVTLIKK